MQICKKLILNYDASSCQLERRNMFELCELPNYCKKVKKNVSCRPSRLCVLARKNSCRQEQIIYRKQKGNVFELTIRTINELEKHFRSKNTLRYQNIETEENGII